MVTSFAPITRHGVVCGICGAHEVCRSSALIRDIRPEPYLGTDVVAASVEFALPAGWAFRDWGVDVAFVCGECSDTGALDDCPDRGREPAVAQ